MIITKLKKKNAYTKCKKFQSLIVELNQINIKCDIRKKRGNKNKICSGETFVCCSCAINIIKSANKVFNLNGIILENKSQSLNNTQKNIEVHKNII